MSVRGGFLALLAVIAGVAGFIWLSSRELPPIVATHYSLNGVSDDFSPRGESVAFWLGIAIALPLVLAILPMAMMELVGGEGLKIPNRGYWLAPERKARTLEYFKAMYCLLAAAVALFVGYAHWLDVLAQRVQPPELSGFALFAGLAALLLVFVVATMQANRRFKNIPTV